MDYINAISTINVEIYKLTFEICKLCASSCNNLHMRWLVIIAVVKGM